MNIMNIVIPGLIVGGMGLLFGLVLAFASKKFSVEKDERIKLVREALPGANCGACGFAGCDAFAEAVVKGEASVNGCPVGKAPVAKKLAEIMGQETDEKDDKVAFVRCQGALGGVKPKSTYSGVSTCQAASDVAGGNLRCRFACLGLGDCERACPFDAIHVSEGLAKVDREKCVGCGICATACPRNVIDMISAKAPVGVACRNTDAGKEVRAICMRGCIACKLCEKKCEYDAIHVKGGVSVVDYDKCVGCGVCVENCPTKAIVDFTKLPGFKAPVPAGV
jgi:electron transport complex protein RnfB